MIEAHYAGQLTAAQVYDGNAAMIVPAGGAHVRQVEVRLPLFSAAPAVACSVFSPQSLCTAFVIYDSHARPPGAQTQIVFSATNVESGVTSDLPFWCSYIVAGKPALPGQAVDWTKA